MIRNRVLSKLAKDAEGYIQREKGTNPTWFLYKQYYANGDTVRDLLKTGGHFIKKRKSMRHSEVKVFPQRLREAA